MQKIIVTSKCIQKLEKKVNDHKDAFISFINDLYNVKNLVDKSNETKEITELAAFAGYICKHHKEIISTLAKTTQVEYISEEDEKAPQ